MIIVAIGMNMTSGQVCAVYISPLTKLRVHMIMETLTSSRVFLDSLDESPEPQ